MYRNAMTEQHKWKQKSNKKPLIIRGARQLGKTWHMRELGKAAFERIYVMLYEQIIEIEQWDDER